MTPALALAFLATFALLVCAVGVSSFLIVRYQSGRERRDELQRAGSPHILDSREAALRAGGSTAWMRPDGGGF